VVSGRGTRFDAKQFHLPIILIHHVAAAEVIASDEQAPKHQASILPNDKKRENLYFQPESLDRGCSKTC
jgi:hypothetical protein